MLIPREHGAWGLLLLPFLCAAILARRFEWLTLAALALALAGFLMREPLVVLARQRWVWRDSKPESATARRCLLWQLPAAALLWLYLASKLPVLPLAILTGVALLVTATAVWMTVRNLQRSILLQLASSFGLASTALLAALASTAQLPQWAWWLWLLLGLHAAGAILIVRARLEIRSGAGAGLWSLALWFHIAVALFALLLSSRVAVPAAVTVAAGALELVRLKRPQATAEPLKRVGWRTLAFSLGQGAASVVALW